MASKKKRSPSNTVYYKAYELENRYSKNRLKRLEAHAKKHPSDDTARVKLATGVVEYRRNSTGHTKKTKDQFDKFRLLKYVWKKAYPPSKKIVAGKNLRAGFRIQEQV